MSNVYTDEVISIAKAEDGYLEKKTNAYLDDKTKNAGNKNYTKYARDVYQKAKKLLNGNKQGSAYCALGILWSVLMASDWDLDKTRKVMCLDGSVDNGQSAAGVKSLKSYFSAKKRYDKNPKVGDVIFFGSGSTPSHVGLVISVTDKQVKTQEWNTSKNGKYGVFQKTYAKTNAKIVGYGHPKYDTKSTVVEPEPAPTPAKPTQSPVINTVVKAKTPASKGPSKELNTSFTISSKTAELKDAPKANAKVLVTIPNGKKVRCYGYYSVTNTVDWLYVRYEEGNTAYEGFVCEKNLKIVGGL